MQSSNDNGQREGNDRWRGMKRGRELANEKRKHCTRPGLTSMRCRNDVYVRVCMYEWCTTSASESERNRASGSACELKEESNTKQPMHFGSIAIDKELCGFCLWSGTILMHESLKSSLGWHFRPVSKTITTLIAVITVKHSVFTATHKIILNYSYKYNVVEYW